MNSACMPDTSRDLKWFVLFTMPHHERSVFRNLTQKGIGALLPMRKAVKQWSDRKMKYEVPYFPNYVFVNIRRIDRYKVFEVPGIVRYLDSNQNPTVMVEEEINMIRLLEGREDIEVSIENFVKGEAVTISSGPLKNYTGVVVNTKGTKKLVLRLDSVKRNLLIDIAAYCLEKIPKGVLQPT